MISVHRGCCRRYDGTGYGTVSKYGSILEEREGGREGGGGGGGGGGGRERGRERGREGGREGR